MKAKHIGAGLLAVATIAIVEQDLFAAEPPAVRGNATGSLLAAAAPSQAGGQTVEAQLSEMRARIQQLESIMLETPGRLPPADAMAMGAGAPPRMKTMPTMNASAKPLQGGMVGMAMPDGGKGGMSGDPAVYNQLAQLRAKIQLLEAALEQQSGSASGAMSMSGQPGMNSGAKPIEANMPGMSGMGAQKGAKPAGGMGGMGGGAMPAAAPMGGAAPGGGMGGGMMSMDTMKMGGMSGGSSSGASMGMMDMDKMELVGMMGSVGGNGNTSMAMPSALPGFPGASHLYHLGATGFFLDHPQHIALSAEQQMTLNQIKEQAALDKASADRSVEEAEQDLWTLTAADQPDNAQIEAKIAEIEKLKGNARLRFIAAIGGAAKILNDGQRRSLTGFAPPAPAAPAAAPMAGGMTDM